MDKEVRELEKALEQIWDIATNKFGLDPFPTRFEIVPATVMYEIGSYALPGPLLALDLRQGLPQDEDDVRLRPVEDLRGRHQLQSVVRLSARDQLAAPEQAGHRACARATSTSSRTTPTSRGPTAAWSTTPRCTARRINEYEFKYGRKVVEEFLDAVLSIEEHIDPYFFIKKRRGRAATGEAEARAGPPAVTTI